MGFQNCSWFGGFMQATNILSASACTSLCSHVIGYHLSAGPATTPLSIPSSFDRPRALALCVTQCHIFVHLHIFDLDLPQLFALLVFVLRLIATLLSRYCFCYLAPSAVRSTTAAPQSLHNVIADLLTCPSTLQMRMTFKIP